MGGVRCLCGPQNSKEYDVQKPEHPVNQQIKPWKWERNPNTAEYAGSNQYKCYQCFEIRHKSTKCPKRANAPVNLAEDDEALDESFAGRDDGNQYLEENEVDTDEEEGIDGDLVGETLVKIP
ncbi:hypothetical protein RHMOL_Rhmol06G0182100 [Rhododendron molle]|uniref:Uncharacterized protein n=1 Tax=Rhododendron molle TaxID=49168 RepID=A0ACC0NDH2_RHOML|nr:hypothetical protein RHMOL_Rhmol06G0182100 [Rhododendron molle]